MSEIIAWIFLISLVVMPLTSIIWLYLTWNKFKETVPFTPEHSRKKRRLIVVAVITAIILAIYVVIMTIYGVKVFFAGPA